MSGIYSLNFCSLGRLLLLLLNLMQGVMIRSDLGQAAGISLRVVGGRMTSLFLASAAASATPTHTPSDTCKFMFAHKLISDLQVSAQWTVYLHLALSCLVSEPPQQEQQKHQEQLIILLMHPTNSLCTPCFYVHVFNYISWWLKGDIVTGMRLSGGKRKRHWRIMSKSGT